MTDFSVPLVQEEVPLLSSKSASEQAFYAAATSSQNPIEDFFSIKTDLEQTGQSSFVQAAQDRWQQESDANNKEAVLGIITDATVSPEIKRAVMQNYAVTGVIPTSLKDKYIEKTAVKELSNSLEDQASQDLIVSTLAERKKNNSNLQGKEQLYTGTTSLTDIIKGTGAVASSLLLSIPAGFAGMYQAIVDQDSTKASEVISAIQQAGYMPEEDGAKHVMSVIMHAAETLGIPAKWMGEKVLEGTGSPVAATGTEVLLDPLNFIPLGTLAKTVKNISVPKIPTTSPLETTKVANPKVAEQLGVLVLKDTSGKAETALGVEKGQIVHDWVLPKAIPDEVAKAYPDLMETLSRNDETVHKSFQAFRYDPNIIEVTKREAEVDSILQVINESSSPKYNQAMSHINETDELFEGKAYFGRNSVYGFKKEADAQKALENLNKSILHLPEESRGITSIEVVDGGHYLTWEWKREYNEIANKVFGPDSIQTSFLGIDVSAIARSSAGRYLFPTGRFPQWTEHAALRSIERGAALREDLTKIIRDRISNKNHGVELDYLIREAEEKGIDYFSPSKIAAMFPKMTKSEVDELFTTHTFWNRQQQYNHNFLNREVRHKMLADNMQGVYDGNGNYLGAATSKIGEVEKANIREVWDFQTEKVIPFSIESIEKQGLTLVRLHEKIKGSGSIHQYAVLGGKNKLNLLPQEVLTRLPGYSGRKVKESWYVDIIPKSLNVNGLKESNVEGLRQYAETRAAARNEVEANKIKEQLQSENKDFIVEARPERTENFGRVLTDHNIHQQLLSHSMKRGERLPSLNGPARLEDRMVTLINTTNSLARMGATRAWDTSFQSAFTKGFGKFTKGEFPQYANEIVPLENMGRSLQKEYKTAHALFKYYERIKNSETISDFLWTKGLNNIADILEKWKIPAGALRGKHQNPLMLGKTIATTAYIHLNPIRQHLIQPAQQLEMYAINPKTAAKNFSNTLAIRMFLGSESTVMKSSGGADIVRKMAIDIGTKAGEKEFLETAEAIKRSGMLQSVDMNTIVHGVFKEVDRNLVENVPERIWKDIETISKAPIRFSRAVGFDAAELNNRVGNWLQVRDIWKERNPEKSWKTKEAQEQISAEALKLSGAMNRAGQLPYQEGVLSIFFQFAAINHKMLMNVLQDNATILSKTERARLAAVRFALYGGKYGIPGGAVAYHFIEQSENEDVKDAAEFVKRGTIDAASNGLLASLVEPDENSDLAVSKILSPYSEGFLPYFAVGWETLKMFDSQPTNPRYPALGMMSSFGQAVEDIHGWFITKEVNENTFSQMAMEAVEVASGFNNYTQGLLMLGMRDRVTKMGNKYGLEFTVAEAYAKMTLGLGTQKEEDLWKLVELEKDTKKQKQEMAKVIHRQMSNQRVKGKEEDYAIKVRKLNSFISLLDPKHFSEADKVELIEEIEKLDKYSYTTLKQSILVDHWKYHQDTMTQERQQINDIMERSGDPGFRRYIEALNKGKL
ncbi:hypothetical protein [Caudoviricetes sp.]|nr:hypothetical protein [Caudoviricetes sp.]